MGSELMEVESGRVLWGIANASWYVSAWTTGSSLDALSLSEAERGGKYGRVRATRLLQFPAFAPMLAGFSPYTALLKGVKAVAGHQSAVAEFAYDWRLPVAYNAKLLAEFAVRHLEAWRAHERQAELRRAAADADRPAMLILVTHSMGGLLARHACLDHAIAELVHATITLGTPFYGAPKAALMLGIGKGAPLPMPRTRLRRLSTTLPGVYDLLPSYRCVTDGTSARRVTADDLALLDADRELAEQAMADQERVSGAALPGHVQVIGAHQPTTQALTFDSGTVIGHQFTYRPSGSKTERVDAQGDGTVPRDSAQLPPGVAMPLAQSHGAVAAASDAVLVVQDVLTETRTGPWQGAGKLGLDLPDVVEAGQPCEVIVSGAASAADVGCSVTDVGSGLRVDTPTMRKEERGLIARVQGLSPGLYWVRVEGGGAAPLQQIVMVTEPEPWLQT